MKVSRLGGNPFKDVPCMLLGHWTSTIPPQLLRSHCLHAPPPLGSPPRKPPPPAIAPRTPAPAHITQHHQRIAGVRKHPLTAQLAADARSVQLRLSADSCAICARLGASDAAPASPIRLTARSAAPRLAPSQTSTNRYSPAHTRPSPHHATSSAQSRRSQPPAHSAASRRCTQRTAQVQRRQLRHPSETRC
jgi:hypothetical protein